MVDMIRIWGGGYDQATVGDHRVVADTDDIFFPPDFLFGVATSATQVLAAYLTNQPKPSSNSG
jgi:hypothetical protein